MRPLRFVRTLTTRNIGIIAHIDAGKTTTTERMLYYAGVTRRLGNVDSGDTVTDFLPAERERGITIQSAAISLGWRDAQINLVDTPGHADFAFEVVRSLRVLDGAVAILDGVAGVEALTESVWARSRARNIPVLAYINKMDRPGAGYTRCVREIVARLRTPVAQLYIPWFDGDVFRGVYDVLSRTRIAYPQGSDGRHVDVTPAPEETEAAWTALVETMADISEDVVTEYVDNGEVKADTLRNAITTATRAGQVTPVLCGASFRNIGVQPLLDAIVDILPDPRPSGEVVSAVSALAFKVRHDPMLGTLVFVRVYDGTLKKGATILNTTSGEQEKIPRLLRMQADAPQDVAELGPGSIGVLVGTRSVRTGDTLVAHLKIPSGISRLPAAVRCLRLMPIEVPPPVFVARISPRRVADQRAMKAALDILLREDPSLQLKFDEDAGQWLLSGLGELHLEVARDRLIGDLGANVDVGPAMITYKETISVPCQSHVAVDTGTGQIKVSCEIRGAAGSPPVGATNLGDENWLLTSFHSHPTLTEQQVRELTMVGVKPVLSQGRLARLAMHDIAVDVRVHIPADVEQAPQLSVIVREAMQRAISELPDSSFTLLEPVMRVTIKVPEHDVGVVVTDIGSNRRGHIEGIGEDDEGNVTDSGHFGELARSMWAPTDHTMHLSKLPNAEQRPTRIRARIPLRTLTGYVASLRSMTQGRGSFETAFDTFEPVPPQDVASVLESFDVV